jgi:hypothetical protein
MKRSYVTAKLTYRSRASTPLPFTEGSTTYVAEEEIWSENHPGWSTGRGDSGGPWFLTRFWQEPAAIYINTPWYIGQVWPYVNVGAGSGIAKPTWLSTASLVPIGSTMVSRVLPTNPSAHLATFIGELISDKGVASLPGKITRERGLSMKAAGGEYLNAEFGWLPFVSDLQDFARAIKNRNKIISQYDRASDTKIRRRYVYSDVATTFTITGLCSDPALTTQLKSPGYRSTLSRERIWFSGAFRYHVPLGNDFYSKALRYESHANRLLGTRITPEVVWNIAPWSWLGDWFGNTGDVLHNISALGTDGLAMQYGYAMRSKTQDMTDVAVSGPLQGSSLTTHSVAKQRINATPYGFGKLPSSLSKRQLAVLAALGMSRGGVPWDMTSSRMANPV